MIIGHDPPHSHVYTHSMTTWHTHMDATHPISSSQQCQIIQENRTLDKLSLPTIYIAETYI